MVATHVPATPSALKAPLEAEPSLLIRDLAIGYAGEPALVQNWNAQLQPGLTWIHGDTGSGKSTLLRVLSGMSPALSGSMTWGPLALPGSVSAWREQCFFVDPLAQDDAHLSVRACAQQLCGQGAEPLNAHWMSLAERLGLLPHVDKGMHMLSTGSRRKVYLCSALAGRHAMVLLDEPTAALDAASIRALREELTRLAHEKQRIVIVASGEPGLDLPAQQRLTLPVADESGA